MSSAPALLQASSVITVGAHNPKISSIGQASMEGGCGELRCFNSREKRARGSGRRDAPDRPTRLELDEFTKFRGPHSRGEVRSSSVNMSKFIISHATT